MIVINFSWINCPVETVKFVEQYDAFDQEVTRRCQDALPYNKCSFNLECGCLPIAD